MYLDIETKYNVGDMVYFILEEDMYNDLYHTETTWRVRRNIVNKYVKFRINKIKVTIDESSHIKYVIDGYGVPEEYIFDSLDLAKKECERLNNK